MSGEHPGAPGPVGGPDAGPAPPALFEDGGRPSLRDAIGGLLAASRTAAFAVSRMRISGLDLTPAEIGAVARCRVLVRRVDADMLMEASEHAGDAARRRDLEVLGAFLASGRVEVRAAGVLGWVPDFSIFRPADVVLVGAHYFGRPYPMAGPSLTGLLRDPAAVALAERRFDALWADARDVLPTVRDAVEAVLEGLAGR